MQPSRTLYAAFGFLLVQAQHQHAAGLTVKTRQDGIKYLHLESYRMPAAVTAKSKPSSLHAVSGCHYISYE